MHLRTDSLRIVGIGGGTGLPVLLRGLMTEPNLDISAIVTVADDGGSSGRLRDGLGIPAVGDLRNCLVALSSCESPLTDLFQHRFSGGDIDGHSLGNLIVAALFQKTGSLREALKMAGQLLPLSGRAFAATEAPATLCAAFSDGTTVRGESQIALTRRRIERVWLEPANPQASAGVLEAIQEAHAIVLGPGSLYTSLIPNLLVAGVARAICSSPAVKILVCNLMTEPGETDNYTASDHLCAVTSYLHSPAIDFCVMNSNGEPAALESYRRSGSKLVRPDADGVRTMGAVSVEDDLWAVQGGKIRHDPVRLGRLIAAIARAQVVDGTESQAA